MPSSEAVATVAADDLDNPNSPLAKRSGYFDFDQYSVKPEYQTLLQAHAGHPSPFTCHAANRRGAPRPVRVLV